MVWSVVLYTKKVAGSLPGQDTFLVVFLGFQFYPESGLVEEGSGGNQLKSLSISLSL